MGGFAARKALEVVEHVEQVLTIEFNFLEKVCELVRKDNNIK